MSAKILLLKWFEEGDLQRVLAGLRTANEYWLDKNVAESLTFQSSRLHSLHENKNRNLVSQADFQMESDRIRQAVLEIIQALPDEWDASTLKETPESYYPVIYSRWNNWIITGTIILVVIIGISYCMKLNLRRTIIEKAPQTQSFPEKSKDNISEPIHSVKPRENTTATNPHPKVASTKERQISGYVWDSLSHPLEGVKVSTMGIETSTDANGYFKLVLDKVPDNLEVRLHFIKTGFRPGDEIYFGVPNNNIGKILHIEKK